MDGVDLTGAKLDGADLSNVTALGAQLRGARLCDADLSRATLDSADLRGVDFTRCQLDGASFRDADLRDADLREARGLLLGQLAGTNIAGAKLPDDIKEFSLLSHVGTASDYTKTLYIGMLAACAYSVLTIFSSTDARLLTNSVSSPLPIIATPIPIAGFFIAAPALLLGIYFYFHVHLLRLWEATAGLPAVFQDGTACDRRIPPWFLNALIRDRLRLLASDRPPLLRLQCSVATILAWWVVPLTIALFWLAYLPRHDWGGTAAQAIFVTIAAGFAVYFRTTGDGLLRGLVGTTRSMLPAERRFRRKRAIMAALTPVVVMGIVLTMSYGALSGTGRGLGRAPNCGDIVRHTVDPAGGPAVLAYTRVNVPALLPCVGWRAFADVTGQDVSTKPPSWNGSFDQVHGATLEGSHLRYMAARRAFMVRANLRKADLQEADLREADLRSANLYRARLEWAQLGEANLSGANLTGAYLYRAILGATVVKETIFTNADLACADLRYAKDLEVKQLLAAINWHTAYLDEKVSAQLAGVPRPVRGVDCHLHWRDYRKGPRRAAASAIPMLTIAMPTTWTAAGISPSTGIASNVPNTGTSGMNSEAADAPSARIANE